MSNIQVGQKIYIVHPHRKGIQEVTVSKVGKKYFQVEELPRIQFFKSEENRTSKSEFGSPIRWYLTIQEYNDEKHYHVLRSRLYKVFSTSNVGTLEQLKQVCEILGIDKSF